MGGGRVIEQKVNGGILIRQRRHFKDTRGPCFALICYDKTLTKQPGEERGYLTAGYGPSFREAKAGTEGGTAEEHCLLAVPLLLLPVPPYI